MMDRDNSAKVADADYMLPYDKWQILFPFQSRALVVVIPSVLPLLSTQSYSRPKN